MYVTGAEKLLFTISDGTEDNTAHVWVYPDTDKKQRIIAGWEQFKKDLEAYEPEPEVIPAQAEPVMALPVLSIQVGGAISIQSNLDRFGERLKAFIGETNDKPETDQDFANLDQACKVLKEAEDALKQAESNALAQTASVDEMRRTVSYLADIARTNRLNFEKLVKSEKENRKQSIVQSAASALDNHCKALQAEIAVAFNFTKRNFSDAIKGKRTLSSMQDAADTMLANAMIDADALARELREKHAWFVNEAFDCRFLFNDLEQIIYKDRADFKLLVESRIKDHLEQERIKAEQAAKAQAEREERIRQEAEAKAKREAEVRERQIAEQAVKAERERIEAERANEIAEHDKNEKLVAKAVNEVEEHQAELKNPASKIPEQRPNRKALIEAVATKFGCTTANAEKWLIDEFGIFTSADVSA